MGCGKFFRLPYAGAGDVRHLHPGCTPSSAMIGSVSGKDGAHPDGASRRLPVGGIVAPKCRRFSFFMDADNEIRFLFTIFASNLIIYG